MNKVIVKFWQAQLFFPTAITCYITKMAILDHEYYGYDNDVYSAWSWAGCSVVVVQNKVGKIVIIDVVMEPLGEFDGD